MKSKRTGHTISALALFVIGIQSACGDVPSHYSAEAISATVLDAKTKKPIEGAIVVAHWELETGMFHTVDVAQMKVFEVQTDKDGRFAFPAWGPEPRQGHGVLLTKDPEILIFKDRYVPFHFNNRRTEDNPERRAVRHSQLNGQTISLEPVSTENSERLAEAMLVLTNRLRFATGKLGNSQCLWKKIPNMMVAAYKQQQTINKTLRGFSTEFLTNLPRSDCGWATEYFRGQIAP